VGRKVAREALKRAVAKAGIAALAPTLHDLRHTCGLVFVHTRSMRSRHSDF
jgi:integrase